MDQKIMKNKINIAIVVFPQIQLEPLHGPALLKAILKKNNFNCIVLDWNFDLWKKIEMKKKWNFLFDNSSLVFRDEKHFKPVWDNFLSKVAEEWIEVLEKIKPEWLGISFFSQRNEFFVEYFLRLMKKRGLNIKVVIGGPYAIFVGKSLKEKGLINAYVKGEGEDAIVNVVKGRLDAPGINENNPVWIEDFNRYPFPDYSDYPMEEYPSFSGYPNFYDKNRKINVLPITGSRGCINSCSFCDNFSWSPKYRFRKGEDVAREMIYLHDKYNFITSFSFNDPLINGNVKELRKMSDYLISYYKKNNKNNFSWFGQFACRKKQHMNEGDYKKCKNAGLSNVSIGIESGSEKIRRDMNKNFTNNDIKFTFDQCSKNKIGIVILLIIGYPTETENDFQETLELLKKYSYLLDKNIISQVNLGPTLGIMPNTFLFRRLRDLGINYKNNPNNWECKKTGNTREVRVDRWLRAREYCLKLGYPVEDSFINQLKESVNIN